MPSILKFINLYYYFTPTENLSAADAPNAACHKKSLGEMDNEKEDEISSCPRTVTATLSHASRLLLVLLPFWPHESSSHGCPMTKLQWEGRKMLLALPAVWLGGKSTLMESVR